MQANEPTSKEYDDIATEAANLARYTVRGIRQFVEHARRMYSSCSDVDNGCLADALDELSRSLATVGGYAEFVHLHAIRCKTEAELREQEGQQDHPVEDKENEE